MSGHSCLQSGFPGSWFPALQATAETLTHFPVAQLGLAPGPSACSFREPALYLPALFCLLYPSCDSNLHKGRIDTCWDQREGWGLGPAYAACRLGDRVKDTRSLWMCLRAQRKPFSHGLLPEYHSTPHQTLLLEDLTPSC